MGLAASTAESALAPGPPPLDFQPFAGAPEGRAASDPTIRPMLRPDRSAYIGSIRPIDLQGNGRPDLFLCHFVDAPGAKVPCRVLRPQADGSLAEVTRQFFGDGTLPSALNPKIVVGDFNGDGRPDIFLAGFGVDAWPFTGETNGLLISNADGTYADRSSTLPRSIATTYTACAGDIDGDGNLDIYVGNFTPVGGQPGPYFLIGKSDGTFAQAADTRPTEVVQMKTGFQAASCALVDVDQDGHADLVLGIFNPTDRSFVLFNDGTGDFTKRPRSALPPGPLSGAPHEDYDMATLDINRDGRPDLIILSGAVPEYRSFGLQILINRGDGTFADETAARLGGAGANTFPQFAASLGVADLNGDGWEDLFWRHTNNWDPKVPRFWINNGNGTWAPVASNPELPFKVISGPIDVLDFDGDGRPDLVWVAPSVIGDVDYESFQNRAPRTVPSEPLVGKAVAGGAEVSVAFAPPLSSGASPITGYTATCALTTFGSAVGVAGAASPITVAGLARGKTYACSVTAANAQGTSLPSAVVNVTTSPNYQGLWWNSPAGSESGWGINFAHQGDTIFATWFTYGLDGKPWWLGVTANQTAPGVFTGDLFTTRGPAFNAVPFNPGSVVETAVGTATFTFTDVNNGTFAYAVDTGAAPKSVVAQTKSITRQVFGTLPTCVWGAQPNPALATNYQDLWWKSPASSESGWGINFAHQGDTIFATWFTYDATGAPWWLAMVAPRVGSKVYSGSLFTVTGPAFNAVPFDSAQAVETTVGNATLAFADGNQATFSYTVNGVTQVKPIARQVFVSPGTVCR